MTWPTDWQNLGVFPLQDHGSDRPEIDLRNMLVGGRIQAVGEDDARVDYAAMTLGDLHPWRHWPNASREIPAWSMVFAAISLGSPGGSTGGGDSRYADAGTPDSADPGGSPGQAGQRKDSGGYTYDPKRGVYAGPTKRVRNDPFPQFVPGLRPGGFVSPGQRSQSGGSGGSGGGGGGMPALPMFSAASADSRFTPVGHDFPSSWPLFPKGWVGVAVAGTDERAQKNIWLPTDPRLLAVNANPVPEMGTIVGDLDPERTWNRERQARLQSAWQVVLLPKIQGVVGGGALAMQFKASRLDSLAGFGVAIGRCDTTRQRVTTGPGESGDSAESILRADSQPDPETRAPIGEDAGIGGEGAAATDSGTTNSDDQRTDSGGYVWDPDRGVYSGGVRSVGGDPFSNAPANTFGFFPPGYVGGGQRSPGGGGGGGGGSDPNGAENATSIKDTKNAVFFLAHGTMYGPIHPGHKEDKHHFGMTLDGQPVNSGHISTDGFFYLDQRHDGPMHFTTIRYPKPAPLPNVSRVHLCWDHDEPHHWAKGKADGKWKWFAEIPDFASPPAVPPPTKTPTPDDTTPPTTPPSTPGTPARPKGPVTPPSTPTSPTTPKAPTTGGDDKPPPAVTGQPGEGANWGDSAHEGDSAGTGGQTEGPASPGEGTGGQGDPPATPGGGTLPGTPSTVPCGGGTTPGGGGDLGNSVSPGGGGGGGSGAGGGDGIFETPLKDGQGGGANDDSIFDTPGGGFVPGMPMFPPGGPGSLNGYGPFCHPIWLASYTTPGPAPRGQGVTRTIMQRNMTTGFASVAFRPQTMRPDAQDYRFTVAVDRNAQTADDADRPVTARLEAYGAGQKDMWDHNVPPGESMYRGGEAKGGAVFLPPHVDLSDHADDFDQTDTTQPDDTSFLVMGPKTALAFGVPDLDTGDVKDGAGVIEQGAGNDALVIGVRDGEATVDVMTAVRDDASGEVKVEMEGTGAVKVPSGTTAQRPTATVNTGDIRFNTTTGALEVYNGTSWVPLASGGPTRVVKTSVDSSTSTSLASESELGVPVTSGEVYKATWWVRWQSASGTTGIGLSLNGPTIDSLAARADWSEAGNTAKHQQIPAWDTLSAGTKSDTAGPSLAKVEMVFKAGADGTVDLRFASSTGGVQVDILVDSFVEYEQIS